jgi:hypothetical protein
MLYEVFTKFMNLAGSHRIFVVHRWYTSFAASASVRPGPSDAQVDSLVCALLQCFQELDAVGELFPPSGLAQNFLAEGALGPSPVTRNDVQSAISDSVVRGMAAYTMQLDINSRVLQKLQVHVENMSSELLDLEATLHVTQEGSKSMFVKFRTHDQTLDRHAQAICDLEHATFGEDQHEDDDVMSDDNDNTQQQLEGLVCSLHPFFNPAACTELVMGMLHIMISAMPGFQFGRMGYKNMG